MLAFVTNAMKRDGTWDARDYRTYDALHDINPFVPTVPTFAVRETASLGIMGEPRVPPLNPSETIVL